MATIMMQLTRRLGAARLALQDVDVPTGRQIVMSSIQKTATQELLSDAVASQRLTGEEMARLSDLITEIKWAPGHADELLASISGKTAPKRRRQQDFRSATSYMTHGRWTALLNPNSDLNAKADFMANFLADLDCINPTEPTYKRLTADICVAHFDKDTARGLSVASKYALMDHLKKEHKRIVLKKCPVPIYLLKLPADPNSLRAENAALFQKLFHNAEPMQSRLDETLVISIDNSFGCRGGSRSCVALAPPATAAAPASTDLATMLAGLLPQLLQALPGASPQGPSFSFTPRHRQSGAKRSLRALDECPEYDESPERVPRRARVDISPSMHNAAAGIATREAKPANKDGISLGQEHDDEDGQASATETTILGEDSEKAAEEQPSKSPGDILLDAIVARDDLSKRNASAKAAAKRKLAAEEKLAAKKVEAMLAAEAKIDAEAKLTTNADVKASKVKASKKAFDTLSAKTSPVLPQKRDKSGISHERSRSQFLCRMQGQPSMKFRYLLPDGSPGEHHSEAAAKKAADKWMKDHKAK